MKSKINEPEVIELKDKISVMETYYLEKNKAYKTILEKKNEDALSQLNKTIQNNAIPNPDQVDIGGTYQNVAIQTEFERRLNRINTGDIWQEESAFDFGFSLEYE
jgi:hypothetical protein